MAALGRTAETAARRVEPSCEEHADRRSIHGSPEFSRTSASGEEFVERFEARGGIGKRPQTTGRFRVARRRTRGLGEEPTGSSREWRREAVPLRGPAVTLPPELATPFGLVLHELATNATKHGALSKEKGVGLISWSTQAGNEHPILKFEWKERNGPPVKTPKRSGFGSVLIEKGLPEASVDLQYLREGVVCTIEVPFERARERWGSNQVP